jgi:tetratricopeptide (TPR) repeat protein
LNVILRLLGVALLALVAPAQVTDSSVDDAWKNLIFQGSNLAVYAHDNAKAEEVFLKALHEAQRFGPANVRIAATDNRLGMVYHNEKKYADAESAFRKALDIFEEIYGSDSIDVANVNYNFGWLLMDEGKASQAMTFLEKCLVAYQRELGPKGLKTGDTLCLIGDSFRLQRAWHEAESPLKQCAAIREANGGVLGAEFGEAENSLALVYDKEGKYGLADGAFKMAEKNRELNLGITSPLLADTLEAHAAMLRSMGREGDAYRAEKLSSAIRKLHQARGK